jgi:uncharacterized secreted protein with C-terminal beta-propeller domain
MKESVKLGVWVASVVGIIALISVASLFLIPGPNDNEIELGDIDFKKFNSVEEFNAYINQSNELRQHTDYYYDGGFGRGGMMFASDVAMESAGSMNKIASDYSTTNIQVEGVDEADIVKNDGKYIYIVSNNQLFILDAYPAEEMKVLSEINFTDGYINEIFVNGDKLILFGNGFRVNKTKEVPEDDVVSSEVSAKMIAPPYYQYDYFEGVLVYDISDKENPALDNEILLDGSYVDSRMVGDYVYIVSNKYMYYEYPEPPVYYLNGVEKTIAVDEIYYPAYPDAGYQFTSVSAIDLKSGEFKTETYLLGTSYTLYMSEENIYLTQQKSFDYTNYVEDMAKQVYLPVLSDEYDAKINEILESDMQIYEKSVKMRGVVDDYSKTLNGEELSEFTKQLEDKLANFEVYVQKNHKTAIYKIEVDGLNIEYTASGAVPGSVLNQYSMDEYDGNFRIATTTGNSGRFFEGNSLNHLYVLDENLEVIGAVEDLAAGERIYSARFMGERAYMVTFRNTDPLFVIDLSSPSEPKVLGYLKVTGFSDYLHPYDETHLIGIGMETTDTGEVGRVLREGVKISLFDVSDFENPVEVAKIEIGDRGTSSEAQYDPKAVLFDRSRNLLVLPISLYEIDENSNTMYGEYSWNGVYVLNVSTENITVIGRITHSVNPSAREEKIGAEKYDSAGNRWVKTGENEWRVKSCYNWTEEGKCGDNDDQYEYSDYKETDESIDKIIKSSGYYTDYQASIRRSLYMDDTLYTVSERIVKANKLSDLTEINKVEMKPANQYYPYYRGLSEPMTME